MKLSNLSLHLKNNLYLTLNRSTPSESEVSIMLKERMQKL